MNELKVFKSEVFEVAARVENGVVLFDAEQVAKCLGITQYKNDSEYVRWERVNEYLKFSPKAGENSPVVGKGSLIPEAMVYKLAFKASNDIAEQFQDWLAVDVVPKIRATGMYSIDTAQLSPELQMFSQILNSLAKTELENKQQNERMDKLEKVQENITQIVALNPNDWRENVTRILNRIAQSRGGGAEYQNVRNESYELLEARGGCKLNIRLENRKKDALANGVLPKSKIAKFTKVDVIAADKRLTEIYLAIVKEMAIANKVEVDGLGA